MVSHMSHVQGLKKANTCLLLRLMTGTAIATPDSEYGIVKSTYTDLSGLIVVSPTAASKFYKVISDIYGLSK